MQMTLLAEPVAPLRSRSNSVSSPGPPHQEHESMSVAKITEIQASSKKGFDDAVKNSIARRQDCATSRVRG
jgi:hypothetical protein